MEERDQTFEGEQYGVDYYEAAVGRGRETVEALAAGKLSLRPPGPYLFPIIVASLFLLLPALALFYGALLVRDGRGATFMVALGACLVAIWAALLPGCWPHSPKRALSVFYRALGRGYYGYARKLVVPRDFADGFPRYFPDVDGLGRGGTPPYRFDTTHGFRRYWQALIRYHTWPYCLPRVSGLRVDEPRPGVYVVDFRLRLLMNTQLWWLLFPAGLLIAIIVDAVTRTTVTVEHRKILLRAGKSYFLLNAGWQGPEEEECDAWL